jgi:hypothetical protein
LACGVEATLCIFSAAHLGGVGAAQWFGETFVGGEDCRDEQPAGCAAEAVRRGSLGGVRAAQCFGETFAGGEDCRGEQPAGCAAEALDRTGH